MAFKTRRKKNLNLIWESGFSYLEILFKLFWYLVLFPPFMTFFIGFRNPALFDLLWPTLTYFDGSWQRFIFYPTVNRHFIPQQLPQNWTFRSTFFFKWPHFLLKGHTFRPSTCTLYYIETTFVILDGVHASVIRCISSML